MSELENQFAKDAADDVTTEGLEQIVALARQQQKLELNVMNLTDALKEAKEELYQVQEVLLPNTMATIGLDEFKLDTGEKLTIKRDVYASIRADFIPEAIAWLDEHSLGDIVKGEVKLSFARGEKEKSEEVIAALETMGYAPSVKNGVHPQTLKATVKEQQAAGVVFPEEFFSIAPKLKSVIKTK